jgi:hypothetical protein
VRRCPCPSGTVRWGAVPTLVSDFAPCDVRQPR